MRMEDALLDILAALRSDAPAPDAAWLDRLVRRHNRAAHDAARRVSKRRLLPYYLQVKREDPARWRSWDVDAATEEALLRLLKVKPRRTASGVATITVLTKPWPCSSACLYCPNDVRMPKSYLANEPACQRAERNFFDPYLQVKARLQALEQMGHVTDKVELIVLGGTWSDYPAAYQRWYVRELFRALNDGGSYAGGPESAGPGAPGGTPHAQPGPAAPGSSTAPGPAEATPTSPTTPSSPTVPCPVPTAAASAEAAADDPALHSAAQRTAFYLRCGLDGSAQACAAASAKLQAQVDAGALGYNQAIQRTLASPAWQQAARMQQASWDEVEEQQRLNEGAPRRMVGLVIETRPDLIDVQSARTLRRLGCTKVQMGIQSLDDAVLARNQRHTSSAQIARAFAVLRAHGFKIHIHFMVNLLGSTPEADKADYRRLVSDPCFCPDEVKLYPCALVHSARLRPAYEAGLWQPYTPEQLMDVLVADVLATPAYVRISRMIRDISSTDIIAGNKRPNLRQLVEQRLAAQAGAVREIRMREIATHDVSRAELALACVRYETATASERFVQWVTPEGKIAGFCRLSLPQAQATREALGADALPCGEDVAMIREVHVYGRVAQLGGSSQGAAQHVGLGRALVEEACRQARAAGYARIAVISAVGTRAYYRGLGFSDAGLYQIRSL